MIIDCHQHTDWHGRRTEDLVKHLDELGVDKAWLLSWEAIDGALEPWYAHLSIAQVFSAARSYPGRFIIGAAPDPRRPNVLDLIRQYHKAGARVFGEVKLRVLMDSPELIAAFRLAGELRMPVLFHLQLPNANEPYPSCWYLGDVDAVERTLVKCPDTIFVAHGPGWWAHISDDRKAHTQSYPTGRVVPGGAVVRLLDEYPNLYCDLSAGSGFNGIQRDPKFGRRFLIHYADRILYGTDFFDRRHLDHLRSIDLPQSVLEKILCGNALKLVPLAGASGEKAGAARPPRRR